MTGKVINFYKVWKNKQETIRKSKGFPEDVWYEMINNGYNPNNDKDVVEYFEDLEDND
mgnify:CR=1 FL=1